MSLIIVFNSANDSCGREQSKFTRFGQRSMEVLSEGKFSCWGKPASIKRHSEKSEEYNQQELESIGLWWKQIKNKQTIIWHPEFFFKV